MKLTDFRFTFADTKVLALGGLGEVGKNMYVVMHENEIIIIDAGVMFPEDALLGIDYVLPDYSFLKKNEDKIKGLFITHGHLDHIGGVDFLLQQVKVPYIYAPKIAAELIIKRLDEKHISTSNLIVYNEASKYKFKYMDIEFFATNHSIPDSYGISITTPNGVIVDTGDFKFDLTPIGPVANLHKMAEIGAKGVKLLMSDSTNALHEGFSISESIVDNALGEVFKKTNGRIIVATFASNVYRLKHIIETARENNRKIALFGRSMESIVEIAIKTGLIKDSSIFVTPEQANKLPANQICLLCTGSQGEPLAALSRIANGSHKQIKLMPDDLVIFSSSPIPGNATSISRIINQLYLKGADVFTNESLGDIHTTGHGNADELKLMLRLLKPEYFMPVHGEYRMLKAHGDLAIDCGVKKENVFICQNGDILEVNKKEVKRNGFIPIEDVYVDGNRVGDIGNIVIKDRKTMSSDGILLVILNIDTKLHELLNNPNITTRGFILVNDNEELLKKTENKVKDIVTNSLKNKNINYGDLKAEISSSLTPFLYEATGRKPIILPVIMDVKKTQ